MTTPYFHPLRKSMFMKMMKMMNMIQMMKNIIMLHSTAIIIIGTIRPPPRPLPLLLPRPRA